MTNDSTSIDLIRNGQGCLQENTVQMQVRPVCIFHIGDNFLLPFSTHNLYIMNLAKKIMKAWDD